jgi:hypothetical protein
LPSFGLTVVPPPQLAAALHFSPVVHTSPSLHAAPVFTTEAQPSTGSQLSAVQPLPSSQLTAACMQAPPEQLSDVHALPSSQLVTCTVPFTQVVNPPVPQVRG